MGSTWYTAKTSVDVSLEIATFDLVWRLVVPEEKGKERKKWLSEWLGPYSYIAVCSLFISKQMFWLPEVVLS